MAAKPKANDNVTRVMLWCVPRTASALFLKCMTYVPDCEVWYEPYWLTWSFSKHHRDDFVSHMRNSWKANVTVENFGSEIIGDNTYWVADNTYSWAKTQLEKPRKDNKKIVFAKDIGAAMDGMYEFLPEGFKHTFFIRHPYKVFNSCQRLFNAGVADRSKWLKLSALPEFCWPSGFFMKSMYDLYKHIKEHLDPNPVIIDTDDLLTDPGRVMSSYCKAVDIPYTDALLQWNQGRECMDKQWIVGKELITLHTLGNVHKSTFESTGFDKPAGRLNRDDLSDEVRHYSDLSMDYYEEMYANRLKI